LTAGDAVVVAARRPEQSPGLAKLKESHGDALQLVKLDVNDVASLKVRTVALRNVIPNHDRRWYLSQGTIGHGVTTKALTLVRGLR